MTAQDPTVRADIAIESLAMVARGPAVSWGAIFAGAVSVAALSFVLLAVGAAFGLSITSPWDFAGRQAAEAAAAAGIGTAIFLVLVHAVASGVGGYLAGRLRSKLTGLRGDETYFRDTAHGMVVWAVSALATILMLACLAMVAVGSTVTLGAAGLSAAGHAAGGALAGAPAVLDDVGSGRNGLGYFIDSLFRRAGAAAPADGSIGQAPATAGETQARQPASPDADAMMTFPQGRTEADDGMRREEVGRILSMALDGEISQDDKAYVTQLVAQETGLSQAGAEQRMNQVIDRAKAAKAEAAQKAKEAADAARKAGTYTALWGAVAMLAGAFMAAIAATWGGRARDL